MKKIKTGEHIGKVIKIKQGKKGLKVTTKFTKKGFKLIKELLNLS